VELLQGPEMKITSSDCPCHLSVKRRQGVECDTENLQMVGHFYVMPSNSDVGWPSGTGEALPSAEQSSDRLVLVDLGARCAIMPQPVLDVLCEIAELDES